ncbi:MAG: FecR domain-containing protein [Phenylobacterium sp.]|uniref:FecR family protein n=1 Tax=Phenylobacterium sp. TaxID=1871053 RepID=UPI0025E7A9E0|nr:FecR domain-containing protein [Phenylobacterium sp.]MBT9470823.1 FecR domain-containing protein [Phenylobacterium sp.]
MSVGDDMNAGGVAEQAARWFVRLQDDASTGDDWLAFEVWLNAAPEHQAAYDALERAWIDVEDAAPVLARATGPAAQADRFSGPAQARRLDAGPPRRESGRRPGPTRRAWGLGAAALAASLAAAVVVVNQWPGVPSETFITPPGQTRQVTLADGSHIWLNAASRLDVRLDRRARRVDLADGEAVFDVTHDPNRPFLISTGQREVRVVGTEFNLRQRNGDFDLTVRRGVVEVRPAGDAVASPTRVAAGHRLVAHRGSPAALSETPPEAAFAWTQGQLVYVDAPLSEIAADLSRSLGSTVRVADVATGQIRFSGTLTLEGRDAVLRRLEAFAPVRADRAGDVIVLRRR